MGNKCSQMCFLVGLLEGGSLRQVNNFAHEMHAKIYNVLLEINYDAWCLFDSKNKNISTLLAQRKTKQNF